MTTTAPVNTLPHQNSGQQHVVMQTPAPVDNTVFLCGDISANMCLGQTMAGHGTSYNGLHYGGLNDDGGGGSGNPSNSNMISMENDTQWVKILKNGDAVIDGHGLFKCLYYLCKYSTTHRHFYFQNNVRWISTRIWSLRHSFFSHVGIANNISGGHFNDQKLPDLTFIFNWRISRSRHSFWIRQANFY